MREIEIKILNINPRATRKKLLSLGAKREPLVLIVEKSFDFPDRRIKKAGGYFRLRQHGKKTELTYKGNVSRAGGFHASDEFEVLVDDGVNTENMLRQLGLKQVAHREKTRERFVFASAHCELDKYPTIPHYLEIEGSKKSIAQIVKKLGLTMSDTNNLTAGQVLEQYGADHNLQKFKK